MITPSVSMVGGGMMTEPSTYPERSYPLSRARTWRLHMRKFEHVNFVTILVMLMLSRFVVREIAIVSLEEAGDVDMKMPEETKNGD